MLQHTFCHMSGIGPKTEKKLWEAGITSWEKWQDPPPVSLPHSSRVEIPAILEKSLASLADNPSFFLQRLSVKEQYRVFPHFRDTICYLDIETTGLQEDAEITTIALYNGDEVHTYINGINLQDIVKDLQSYSLLVTYNGKCFDIPFMEKYFDVTFDHAHLDLRYPLASLGYKGGLKGCEKSLGIARDSLLDGVDGYWAVLLWHEYIHKSNIPALETLLAYNIEDVVNLEKLLVLLYNISIAGTPFHNQCVISMPDEPPQTYFPDAAVVEKIRNKYLSQKGMQ